ncbi:ZIP family metal transporter [Brevibacillus sp. H7]|uniref:ZIP family metal transporter n=1 Tax=Brevibacillus sp. H7 TaxID=3349138 RepID=UPI003806BC05
MALLAGVIFSHEQNMYIRSGLMIGAGIALHNFPAGLMLGTTSIHLPHLGRDLGLVMFLHNLPEGVAMGIPLALGRVKPLKLVGLVLAISSPFFVGAIVGSFIHITNTVLLSVLIAAASGMILYVSWNEIFFQSLRGIAVPVAFLLFVLGYYLSKFIL